MISTDHQRRLAVLGLLFPLPSDPAFRYDMTNEEFRNLVLQGLSAIYGAQDAAVPEAPFATGNPTGVSNIGNATTPVLSANPLRKYAVVCNNGAVPIYLCVGNPAVAAKGVYLIPGGTYEIAQSNLTLAAVFAIAPTGTGSVSVMEGV